MNKRGTTNIEFVLAFILFAGFVTTAIYLFNPIKSTGIPDSTVNYIVNEIIGNMSVELDSYSVIITNEAAGKEIVAIRISGVDSNKKVRAENYNGKQLNAMREGEVVYVNREEEDFVSLKFCEDFTEMPASEAVIKESYYKIASSNSDMAISEARMLALKENYETGYSELKNRLGVPANTDFSFAIVMGDGIKISVDRSIPARAEVFSESTLKEILRRDGSSEFGEITIKIW